MKAEPREYAVQFTRNVNGAYQEGVQILLAYTAADALTQFLVENPVSTVLRVRPARDATDYSSREHTHHVS